MNPRNRIVDALSPIGSTPVAAVTAYDSIFVRDHWSELSEIPWWYRHSGVVEYETQWVGDYLGKSGLDWIVVHPSPSRDERAARNFEVTSDGVLRVDKRTGEATRLTKPAVSGTNTPAANSRPQNVPETRAEIDLLIPSEQGLASFDAITFAAEGRNDVSLAIGREFDVFRYGYVAAPVWSLYGVLGYEGMMILLATQPELAEYAAQRILQSTLRKVSMIAALEAEAIWIEDCLTDQIDPILYKTINVPLIRRITDAARDTGLKSIYYYCGNPFDRFEAILDIGADGLHFEESKKTFSIDIADVVDRVPAGTTLFGNLDSVGILQNGSKRELETEINRQIIAGERTDGRFIMSTGSPITPGTPIDVVRRYADIVGGARI